MTKNTKKRIKAIVCVAMLAVIAVFGTVAYLTDTESAVNVMTVGKVDVQLIEKQRGDNGGLEDFQNDKTLNPIIGSAQGDKDTWGLPTADNYVDKIITVENIGRNDAWVRVLVGFPVGMDADDASEMPLHWNSGNYFTSDGNFVNNNPVENADFVNWDAAFVGKVTMAGSEYNVYSFTRNVALEKGTTTASACVVGFYLDSRVDWDDEKETYYMTKADGTVVEVTGMDANGKVNIPVIAQAVQTDGFDAPADAFNATFPVSDLQDWFAALN